VGVEMISFGTTLPDIINSKHSTAFQKGNPHLITNPTGSWTSQVIREVAEYLSGWLNQKVDWRF
jgi:ABC-type iron transport system FetAB ATPase subunit